MKIDGITLLQMIKDDTIKPNTKIEVTGGYRTHYPYVSLKENKRLYWMSEDGSIEKVILSDELLECDFEIVKEVEKPKMISNFVLRSEKGETLIGANMWGITYKLNELTNAVNYLLNKSDKDE